MSSARTATGDGGRAPQQEHELALRQAREARLVLDWLRGDLAELDPEGIYELGVSHFGGALSVARAEVLKATAKQYQVRARTGGRPFVLPRERLARDGQVTVRRRAFATGRHVLPRLRAEEAKWARILARAEERACRATATTEQEGDATA